MSGTLPSNDPRRGAEGGGGPETPPDVGEVPEEKKGTTGHAVGSRGEAAGGPRLGRRLRSAVLWAYLGQYVGKLLVFVATLVLARILVPEDFALVALALAILTFLDISDLGIGAAIVWLDREEAQRDASAVFTLHLIGATILVAVINLAAPLVGTFADDPRAVTVVRLLSLNVLVAAVGYTHENLLRRELDFRRRFWPDITGGTLKGVASVALAVAGAGVWSLVAGQLLGTVARAIALWVVVPFRPRFDLGRGGRAGRLVRFGAPLALGSVLYQIVLNVDYVVIANVLGLTALGYYVIAFRIPQLVLHGPLITLSSVIFPYYSRARELEGDVLTRYLGTLRVTALVAAPIAAVVAGLSGPLILVLFGPKWEPAVAVMPPLALMLVMDQLAGYAGDLYKAHGRTALLAALEAIRLVILVPGLVLAAHISLEAVAWAQALIMVVVGVGKLMVASRVLDLTLRAQLAAIAPACVMAAVAGITGFTVTSTMPDVAGLVVGIPLVLAVYAALALALIPETRVLLIAVWKRLRARTA